MNIKEYLLNPRTLLELILICLIIFLFVSRAPEIRVDSNGVVENVALTFSFTGDGALILSDPDGKVILQSPLKSLNAPHSIAISTSGKDTENLSLNSLFEMIIPSAFAAGKFFKIKANVDGQITCRWYNDNTPC